MNSTDDVSVCFSRLSDPNPSVVIGAIKSLLPFKTDSDVKSRLISLRNHPNEFVRDIIEREFFRDDAEYRKRKEIAEKYVGLLRNTAVKGDALSVLKLLPDDCVQLTITSPPYYNAKDYTFYRSYNDFLDFLERVFSEVYRVTEEGRFIAVNTSPVIIPRISRSHAGKRYPIPFDLHSRLVKIGFEFIDDIIWLKPEGAARNRNGNFYQSRRPLMYKPNIVTEYVMIYRKKTPHLIDWNISQYDEEIIEKSKIRENYEKTNVWRITPSHSDIHPATFPDELVKRLVLLYSFVGDLVMDPFAGIGTVGKVCRKTHRNFFLIELNDKYFGVIRNNLGVTDLYGRSPKFYSEKKFAEKMKGIW